MAKINKKGKEETVTIPGKMPIIEQKDGRVKSVYFTLIYPDGRAGAISITKITPQIWQPSEQIESIKIVWK